VPAANPALLGKKKNHSPAILMPPLAVSRLWSPHFSYPMALREFWRPSALPIVMSSRASHGARQGRGQTR